MADTSTELQKIEQWRYRQLMAMGIEREDAQVLAAGTIDIHDLFKLLQRGCSIDLALRILL